MPDIIIVFTFANWVQYYRCDTHNMTFGVSYIVANIVL